MIKLIITDIDGTLLPDGSFNPPLALAGILKNCLDAGIVIALASGRPLAALDILFPELKDRLTFICSNGTQVVQNGKVISLSPVAAGKELVSLMEVVRALHCDFIVDTSEATLAEDQVSLDFYQAIREQGLQVEKVPDVTAYPDPVLKISIAHPDGPLTVLDMPGMKRFNAQYTLTPTGGIFYDIIASGVDKGTAVKAIQQQLDIKPDETVVFGNALNDVPMFETTPHSYAVENAPENVKVCASHTILPPEQEGVWGYLSSLLETRV